MKLFLRLEIYTVCLSLSCHNPKFAVCILFINRFCKQLARTATGRQKKYTIKIPDIFVVRKENGESIFNILV